MFDFTSDKPDSNIKHSLVLLKGCWSPKMCTEWFGWSRVLGSCCWWRKMLPSRSC